MFQTLTVLMTSLLLAFPLFAKKEVQNSYRIVIIGDSLSRGYGVAIDDAYPALLEAKLKKAYPNRKFAVVNGSESGATSASGLSRMRWQFKKKPDIVIIALGSNDGLRGFKLSQTEENVKEMLEFAVKNKVKPVLAGLKIPPNYGPDYTKKFEKIFQDLATEFKVAFIPFLLEGVGGEDKFMQSDGLHPNEEGHKRIANTVFQSLKDLL